MPLLLLIILAILVIEAVIVVIQTRKFQANKAIVNNFKYRFTPEAEALKRKIRELYEGTDAGVINNKIEAAFKKTRHIRYEIKQTDEDKIADNENPTH